MNDNSMNDGSKVFLGFLTGLFAGAVAGVLLAPDKGDATRKLLAEKAKTFSNDVNDQINPSLDKFKSTVDTISDYATKLLNRAEETANNLKQKNTPVN